MTRPRPRPSPGFYRGLRPALAIMAVAYGLLGLAIAFTAFHFPRG